MEKTVGIGVMASGGGSNFEALSQAVRRGEVPGAEVRLLICDRPGAVALARAEKLGVEALVIEPKDFPDPAAFYRRAADAFAERRVSLICLAGYLRKVDPGFIRKFPGRILNIHPALLPKFGGKGMWGHHVHAAVVAAGEKESGCTVHVVDEEYDRGAVLAQARVPVLAGDTPEALAARILVEEHKLYPRTVAAFLKSL